jgi:hypothetical protein
MGKNSAERVESFSAPEFRLEFQLEGRHRNVPYEVPAPEVSFSAILRLGYIDGRSNSIVVKIPP